MAHHQLGDLHPAAFLDGKIHPTVGFDYDEVDRRLGFEQPEDTMTWSDASAALSLILGWACVKTKRGGDPIITTGMRIHALMYMIDPVNSRFENMTDIAAAAGMTRAGVSKALMELRDQLGDILPIRGYLARASYRQAQAAALKAGCHSSQRRRRRSASAAINSESNAPE